MKTLTRTLTVISVIALGLSSGIAYSSEDASYELAAHGPQARYNNDFEPSHQTEQVTVRHTEARKIAPAEHELQARYNGDFEPSHQTEQVTVRHTEAKKTAPTEHELQARYNGDL